jgi:hypothetical protein
MIEAGRRPGGNSVGVPKTRKVVARYGAGMPAKTLAMASGCRVEPRSTGEAPHGACSVYVFGMDSSPEITVAHVQAVHDAANDSEEEAGRRDARMPSSAKAIRERAIQLREVEGFLLQIVPEAQRATHQPFVRMDATRVK